MIIIFYSIYYYILYHGGYSLPQQLFYSPANILFYNEYPILQRLLYSTQIIF